MRAVHARDWEMGARRCPSRWVVLILLSVEFPEITAAHCRRHVQSVTHTVRSKADDIWSFGSGWTGLSRAGIGELHCICKT